MNRAIVRLIPTSLLSPAFPGLSSHASASLSSDAVLVCGGEGGPRVLNSADDSLFLVHKAASTEWSVRRLANDVSLLGHAAASVDGVAFLFGGRQGGSMGDSPDSNAILQFDALAHVWQPVAPAAELQSPQPEPRSYHAMTGARGRFFVFGGCSGHSRLNDLWAFDVAARQWSLLHPGAADDAAAAVPHVRGGSAIFVNAAEDALFVVMGFAGRQLGDVWQFDLAARRWSLVDIDQSAPRPEPRSVYASASVGDHFYLFGGEREPSATGHSGAGTFFDDAWRFDARSRQWTKVELENGPSARGWCAMSATSDGRQLVLSGGLNNRNERLSEIYLFDLLETK